jgi:hypothetical protein
MAVGANNNQLKVAAENGSHGSGGNSNSSWHKQ